jgi:hypothetical protein
MTSDDAQERTNYIIITYLLLSFSLPGEELQNIREIAITNKN